MKSSDSFDPHPVTSPETLVSEGIHELEQVDFWFESYRCVWFARSSIVMTTT